MPSHPPTPRGRAMSKWIFLSLLILPLTAFTQEKKKSNETFTDPAKAGADFAFQGEYVGTHGEVKVGMHVIAQGDGVFSIRGLFGGLPGDGWDGNSKLEFNGKIEEGKVVFSDPNHKGTIADGKITVKIPDNK